MSRKAAEAAPDTDFFEDAACQGADTSVFFAVSDTYADEAKAICATCPVAEQCLEYAIATHQADGVWGGLTALERHRRVTDGVTSRNSRSRCRPAPAPGRRH